MIIMLCDGFMNTLRITKYDNKAIASDTEPRIGLPAASGFHRLRALRFTGVIDSTSGLMCRRERWHAAKYVELDNAILQPFCGRVYVIA